MRKKDKGIIPTDKGFFRDIAIQIKLIFRLLADPRVHPLIKMLPIGSIIYLVFPDLFPLNPIDDAVIIGLGTYMFVELCPPEVVQEHRDALTSVVTGTWRDVKEKNDEDTEEGEQQLIEGEFKEK